MIGLDAIEAETINGGGASSLAFDLSSAKLIIGAQAETTVSGGKLVAGTPIRIWDKANKLVRPTKVFGPGPVTFDADNRPLALTVKDQDQTTLVLWDLDKEQPVREFDTDC